MRVSTTLSAALGATFLAAAIAVGGPGGGGVVVAPDGAEAASCKMGQKAAQKMGITYVLNFKTRRVGCSKAKRVVRAFHQCRRSAPKGGKRGRCTRNRVAGYRCREGKRNTSFVGYHAKVNCKRGGRRVNHLYQVAL